jgi:hypothetical protein
VTRFKKEAQEARKENIIDMGLTFSAMVRLFSKGSKGEILKLLRECLEKLSTIESQESYAKLHGEFCDKFSKKIYTASKVLKNKKTKASRPASFGQAAKVLDIVIKVYVHYSNLPDDSMALKVKPFLNAPIDNPIMEYLKERYKATKISAGSIEAINESQYKELQGLVRADIHSRFNDEIFPVEFDDILWKEKNRSKA